MKPVQRLALILANSDLGLQWPEKVVEIELWEEETEERMEDGDYEYNYIGAQFGTVAGRVTREEFEEFLKKNPNYVQDYHEGVQLAVAALKELSETIADQVKEGRKIAEEYSIPFVVELGGGTRIDVDKVGRVDWNSSSFAC